MDRYNYELGAYAASKFRITRNQTAEDHFVYFADDPIIQDQIAIHQPKAQMHGFSLKDEQVSGGWLHNEQITINIKSNINMSIQKLALQGKHNISNSMASSIISQVLDIRNDVIRESLSDFQNVEHRLEKFITISGVDYINDSKSYKISILLGTH